MLKPKVGILKVFTIGTSGWKSISVHNGNRKKNRKEMLQRHMENLKKLLPWKSNE